MKVTLQKGKKKLYFNIPASWNELTLGRYMRLMKTIKESKDDKEIEQVVKILNCISDIPKKEIYGLDIKSVGILGNHIKTFLETEPNDELEHFITVEDVQYGFHPKLVDMTLGEFVDLETYTKDINENLHKILSILYRPVKQRVNDKYIIEDYEPNEERANLFKKHLKVKDFNGASVFFYDLERQLLIHTNKSLKDLIMKEKQNLVKQ